ncbi:MAG: hypothetical protein CRU78_05110 [Candidatus Accumulibacter phosphatis]|uniref:Phosphotyrosine protein phosphatase I domain-containing protein n=1 Tax=Candidatus Accumulibacter phosphatis TaxID=327160 RepID=A0A6A7RSS0_9PROT|nr:hypothetical protein [Candidatus Accumulibacter phosphatis]
MNLLFLCTGNSCRSILAEVIFSHLASRAWKERSGYRPSGETRGSRGFRLLLWQPLLLSA